MVSAIFMSDLEPVVDESLPAQVTLKPPEHGCTLLGLQSAFNAFLYIVVDLLGSRTHHENGGTVVNRQNHAGHADRQCGKRLRYILWNHGQINHAHIATANIAVGIHVALEVIARAHGNRRGIQGHDGLLRCLTLCRQWNIAEHL